MPTEGSAQLGMRRNWEGLLPRHHPGHTSGSSLSLPRGSAHPAPTQSPENCCLGPGAQHGRAHRASHRIWLMRGTPHPPSHGGVRAPPPCPGGPVQGPGECAHGGVSPTGNEEEAGKACCPESTQDTPQGPVSACHGAQHTRLRPRAPRTAASEAAGGPGAQRGRAQRLQSEKASSAGIPWDSLGCFQSPDAHITRLAMGAGPRDPLKGNRDLSLLSQRHRPAGYWPAHWADRTSVPAGPPAPGTHVPPPQPEPPPPRAPAPAWALAGEPESGHELPPLQGEPALAPAQDPMPMMTDSPLQGEQAPALDRELALSGNTSSRGVVGSAASIPVCSPWMPSTHSPPRGD
ncbi:proline-rich protein 2-like isoform X1 [Cervus canadensis]|uniref:proline-rich protein 2-like isoform X1 n=1 Tax=Cervus canadensis TaxID=1574408 RepID=UPI001CA32627|nr:proline-rich protein 2-like isoform X1 [Cervus canadensis]XP_043294985.1 proline-rich protein 2-like isoform X1 [Cervus canadensis]XP_043294986.1 proline-rich protein 2-like isoform X1 [Cervus canadensis]XP_043294987.1 proline-rich protein 2-like isoform X1 [Cervus canadensis]XP_043294988.1 proline-rich protein 2-like isoform X1 [Cervus canadensis]